MPVRDRRLTLQAARCCWVLAGSLFLASCALDVEGGRSSAQDSTSAPDMVLARIGDEEVTRSDLRGAILDRYYGRSSLSGYVRQRLFEIEAERLGLRVEPREVERRLEEELDRMLGGPRVTHDVQAAALARRDLDHDALRQILRPEIENALLLQAVTAALRPVEDEDVRRLYEKTYSSEQVRLRHIAFPFRSDGKPSEAQVEATRLAAVAAREQLDHGADFGELARTLSGNVVTGQAGGEIGVLQLESLGDPELVRQVSTIPIGEFSGPLREADYGWHLFQPMEKIDARPLEEVRELLVARLRSVAPSAEEVALVEERIRARVRVQVFVGNLQDGDSRDGKSGE